MAQKMSRHQVNQELEQTFGFAPEFYGVIPDEAASAAWGLQRDFELSDQTKLDHKTKELIGLAVAAHIKCRYCIYFHTAAARAFGATDEELREAIAMGGMTVMFSNNLTGMEYPIDAFRAEVDRALEYVMAAAQQTGKGAPQPRGRA